MKAGGHLRVAVVFVAFTVLSILYLVANDQLGHLQVFGVLQSKLNIGREPDWKADYLVHGEHCRIRNMDPFDVSIQQYLAPTSSVVCSNVPPLSHIQTAPSGGHNLIIEQSLLARYKSYRSHHVECCYSVVTRVSQSLTKYNGDADRKYKVHPCQKVDQGAKLNTTIEFILVRCQSIPKKYKKGKIVYENMHAIVPRKVPKIRDPRLYEPVSSINNTTLSIGKERLNVLIIGIDSVSRLSLRRTMPSTLNYLQSYGWLELEGYNKIADNTFPNLMAILSGRNVDQLKQECMMEKLPRMDGCPSLWKDFRDQGYVTAYAEDVPSLATFNYKMTGFVEPPTDFYMRPFMLAAHALLPTRNKDGLPICIGPESAADLIFNYAKSFATTYRSVANYFGLFWLNSFSHNDVNAPAALDLRLFNLLKELEDTGTYNNTLVVILSDHGIRFGNIRDVLLGYLEERLPFIFFHFPQWFLDKYPTAHQNMLINKNRLTSPYDVFSTLKQILGDDQNPPKACPQCKTLLEEVPNDRRCQDAGIDPHWCTCSQYIELLPSNPLVKKVGEYLFQTVINKTRDLIISEKARHDLCDVRTMNTIVRAHLSKPYGEQPTDSQVFVIVIMTDPFALFEATIKAVFTENETKFEVLGFISRLDGYFSTTKCVQAKMLQFYCHCAVGK